MPVWILRRLLAEGRGSAGSCRRQRLQRNAALMQRTQRRMDGIDLEPKAEITYDDFAKLQFQVGEIIKCEAVSQVQEAVYALRLRSERRPARSSAESRLITHQRKW